MAASRLKSFLGLVAVISLFYFTFNATYSPTKCEKCPEYVQQLLDCPNPTCPECPVCKSIDPVYVDTKPVPIDINKRAIVSFFTSWSEGYLESVLVLGLSLTKVLFSLTILLKQISTKLKHNTC